MLPYAQWPQDLRALGPLDQPLVIGQAILLRPSARPVYRIHEIDGGISADVFERQFGSERQGFDEGRHA